MLDYVNDKPLEFTELLKIENKIYDKQVIKENIILENVNIRAILEREKKEFNDKIYNMPQNIFYISKYKGKIIVGRKIRSILSIENKISAINCSRINASMLFGFLYKSTVRKKDIKVSYYPFTDREKLSIFNEIKKNSKVDICYPFKYRDYETNLEKTSPADGWTFDLAKKT